MTDPVCNYTATCPAPSSSGHLPGCPSTTVPRLAADVEQLEPAAPMFPSPPMDYALRGLDDEPAWFPPYFVVGFACGVVCAAIAVFVGFMLAVV